MIDINHKSLGFDSSNTDVYEINVTIRESYDKNYGNLIAKYTHTLLQLVAYNKFCQELPIDEEALKEIELGIDRSDLSKCSRNMYKTTINITFKDLYMKSFNMVSIVDDIEMLLLEVNTYVYINIYFQNIEAKTLIFDTKHIYSYTDLNLVEISDSKVDIMYILYPFRHICLDNTSTIMLSEFLLDCISTQDETKQYKFSGPRVSADINVSLINNILKNAYKYTKKGKYLDYLANSSNFSKCKKMIRDITDRETVLCFGKIHKKESLLELKNGAQVQYLYYLANIAALLHEEIGNKYCIKLQSIDTVNYGDQVGNINFLSDIEELNLRYYQFDYPNIKYPYTYISPKLKDIVEQIEKELKPIELNILEESVSEFL